MLKAFVLAQEFSDWNWAVVGVYLALVFAIGLAAGRHQKTSRDFFLAGRSMGLIPVGLSMAMTLFSAISYMSIANQSYYFGVLLISSLVMQWMEVPVICLVVIPFFYKLNIYSIYEYLELRFHLALRIAASFVFLFWRMLWLATVVYAPCRALQGVLEIATGDAIPIEALVILVGSTTTVYTLVGGIRAVIWTDVMQAAVMFLSIVAIVGVVWSSLDQGPATVWQIAEAGGRTHWIRPAFDWQDAWSVWGLVPFFFLARLSFYTADQITVQRVLTARNVRTAQWSFVVNCAAYSLALPLLCYVGLALYSYYQSHPEQIPAGYRSAESAAELQVLAQQAPGERPPDAWLKSDPDTGKKLEDKILPTFIARELPVGIAGLVISALFAACMSTMDSGLNSIATALIVDFHRRLGIGRHWLAHRKGKPVSELDEADELTLARPIVLLIGCLATGFGCIIGELGTIFEIARTAVDTPGIPLACVFLMGMLTRRTNTAGAIIGLAAGVLCILWLSLGPRLVSILPGVWPWFNSDGSPWELAPVYPGSIGAAVTVALGYAASLLFGRTKSDAELQGLTRGLGIAGELAERNTLETPR